MYKDDNFHSVSQTKLQTEQTQAYIKNMPDVATKSSNKYTALDWVGMGNITQPITFIDNKIAYQVQAKMQVFVDLSNKNMRGIHMSRLYLITDSIHTFDYQQAQQTIQQLIKSHSDISNNSKLILRFELTTHRPSLISNNQGFRTYPVEITLTNIRGKISTEVEVCITYSSTCPCSAALSQQLTNEAFLQAFADKHISKESVSEWLLSKQGLVAVPHSQRSHGKVKVKLDTQADDFYVLRLIDSLEDAIQTRVQAAVKREDEQEFARINAKNTMFCEDAGRRLQKILSNNSLYTDFTLRIDHYESLHEHDAVCINVKGVAGGYQA